jgi:putative nucleotidyltransferase with HDIG domain
MNTPTQSKLHDALVKLKDLPPVSAVVRDVINSFSDPDLSVSDLAQKIGLDQALVAKVIRVSNSPLYGRVRKIGSINEAVVVLGFSTVRSLVLSALLMDMFPARVIPPRQRRAFWERRLQMAYCARAIARRIRMADPELAYAAALLHDLGLLAMETFWQVELREAMRGAGDDDDSLCACERKLLGFDHCEVGAELATMWNFPAEICHVIRYYGKPDAGQGHHLLSDITYAAKCIAGTLAEGAQPNEVCGHLSDVLKGRLKLDGECLEVCGRDAELVKAYASGF